MANFPAIKYFGLVDYQPVWQAMQDFSQKRESSTTDEIWVLEHRPVFTLGLAGKPEHLLEPRDIPVVKCDRGGQVTYHGPGQVIAYLLLDLRQRGYGVRELVQQMEEAVIRLLSTYNIRGKRKDGAPGVYVEEAKISALGLRIKRGCSYHGLAINVDMDLEPFSRINPCGYSGLQVTQLKDLGINVKIPEITEHLLTQLQDTIFPV